MSEILLENLVLDIERTFKKLKTALMIYTFSKLKQNLSDHALEAKSKKYRTHILILVFQSCEHKLSQLKIKANKQNMVQQSNYNQLAICI